MPHPISAGQGKSREDYSFSKEPSTSATESSTDFEESPSARSTPQPCTDGTTK